MRWARRWLGGAVAILAAATACGGPSRPPSSAPAPAPSTSPPPSEWWAPRGVVSWHWMLDHPLRLDDPRDLGLTDPAGNPLPHPPPEVYDIDGEQNPAGTVAALHARGAKVICYVDVGAYEDYRPDAHRFPPEVIGKPDPEWEGSWWLDIRRLDVLLPIMRDRFEDCRAKGFDAVEPDQVDGYANDTGFPLTAADQLRYNIAIAELAHEVGLSVGLKGDVDQAAELWPFFDWTLNEECFRYDECGPLVTHFLGNGKPVLHVEYDLSPAEVCPHTAAWGFNTLVMPRALDGGRRPCP